MIYIIYVYKISSLKFNITNYSYNLIYTCMEKREEMEADIIFNDIWNKNLCFFPFYPF